MVFDCALPVDDVYIQKCVVGTLVLCRVDKLEYIQGIELTRVEVQISGYAVRCIAPQGNPPAVQIITFKEKVNV